MIIKQLNLLRRFNNKKRQLLSFRHLGSLLPFKLTDIGEGINEVELLKWFVKKGDKVRQFDRLCEVQSDKATVEITSRYDGVIATLHFTEGSLVKVGATLVEIESDDYARESKLISDHQQSEFLSESQSSPENTAVVSTHVLATPFVRKLAKEREIDLSLVKGSGPGGRIMKGDIIGTSSDHASSGHSSNSEDVLSRESGLGSLTSSSSEEEMQGSYREVSIKGIQRVMFNSMTESLKVLLRISS